MRTYSAWSSDWGGTLGISSVAVRGAWACKIGVLTTSLLPLSPAGTSVAHLCTRVGSCPVTPSGSAGGMSGDLKRQASQLGASPLGTFHGNCPQPGWPLSTSGSLMCVWGTI